MLRFLSVNAGKRIYMPGGDVTKYYLVNIGDDAALNEDCDPQTHLFKDRIMKVGPVKLIPVQALAAATLFYVMVKLAIMFDCCRFPLK